MVGLILILIVVGVLIYSTFLLEVSLRRTNKVNEVEHKYEGKALQREFKSAYLWAYKNFGSCNNLYDELDEDLKRFKNLGVDYFTYYRMSRYECLYYPKYIPKPDINVSGSGDEKGYTQYANEFISIVNNVRENLDMEQIELFHKYGMFNEKLLTDKFKVDTMKLFKLPE